MANQGINRPEKLNPSHQVDQFDCGNIQLNNWLTEILHHSRKGVAERAEM